MAAMSDLMFVVSNFNSELFTTCQLSEVDESLAYAKDSTEKDLEMFEGYVRDKVGDTLYWVGRINSVKKTLDAGFKAVTYDEYMKLMEEKWLTREPVEITSSEFHEALNVLPPLNWVHNEKYSMFHISEPTYGVYHAQYLYDKTTGKYWWGRTDITDKNTWLDKILGV